MDVFTILGIVLGAAPAGIGAALLGLSLIDRKGFRRHVTSPVDRICLWTFAALLLAGYVLLIIGGIR